MDIKKISEELLSVVFKYETFTQKKETGEKLLFRLHEIKRKQKRRRRLISYSVAATVAIVMTVGAYMLSRKAFYAEGDILAITLPDQSRVRLESGSSLSYNGILWLFRRNVYLKGDAQFKVTSGESFSVQTALGKVRVLGTEFSVRSSSERLDVECFEGVVEVTTKMGGEILRKGDIIECIPTENIFTPRPAYYQYSQVPVAQVLERIESLYGVTVLQKERYKEVIFDGVITTQSLTEALDVLTMSCDMTYQIENNKITIATNE